MSERQRIARENLEWYTTQRTLAKCDVGSAGVKVRALEERVKQLDATIDYWRKALWLGAATEEEPTDDPAQAPTP